MGGVILLLPHTPSWGRRNSFTVTFTTKVRNNSFEFLLNLPSNNHFSSDCGLCILLGGQCFVGTSYLHLNSRSDCGEDAAGGQSELLAKERRTTDKDQKTKDGIIVNITKNLHFARKMCLLLFMMITFAYTIT